MEKRKQLIRFIILILIGISIFLLMIHIGLQINQKKDPPIPHPPLSPKTPNNQTDSINVDSIWEGTEFLP